MTESRFAAHNSIVCVHQRVQATCCFTPVLCFCQTKQAVWMLWGVSMCVPQGAQHHYSKALHVSITQVCDSRFDHLDPHLPRTRFEKEVWFQKQVSVTPVTSTLPNAQCTASSTNKVLFIASVCLFKSVQDLTLSPVFPPNCFGNYARRR